MTCPPLDITEGRKVRGRKEGIKGAESRSRKREKAGRERGRQEKKLKEGVRIKMNYQYLPAQSAMINVNFHMPFLCKA